MTPGGQSGLLIAVITWNGEVWVERCLDSVLAAADPRDEVIVIDNGSEDGTPQVVESGWGGRVRLLSNRRNRGFAEACNTALQEMEKGGYAAAVILNQDTWMEEDCLERVRSALGEEGGLGLVSPVQLTFDGEDLDPPFGDLMRAEDIRLEDLTGPGFSETTEMIGAAMVIPRTALEAVGGFDSVYFAYAEESDLVRRMRYHGLRVGVVAGARVHHHHSRGKVERPLDITLHIIKNGYLYRLKDPEPSFPGLLLRFVTRDLWQVMRNKGSIADPRYLAATAAVLLYVLITLPRTWWVRRKERKGRTHV